MKAEWISVNEKLPECNKQVIFWSDSSACIGIFDTECSQCSEEDHFTDGITCFTLEDATHWMNLPKGPAPKEGKPVRPERNKKAAKRAFNPSLKKQSKFNFWV